ncbi:MAG: efflux RND transporter periplasmic adaptor subunit [Betaproteobacteria bacterium]|nr:efflux RND transporter periplasmic adaptor subunit [Betaproteobacteria bacterium]
MKSIFPLLFLALPAHAWEAKPLSELAVYPERTAQAQVVSLNESKVAAEISARIEQLAPEPGQVIAKGALIARLDCRDSDLAAERAKAALAAAEAQARLATVQFERANKLANEKFVSRESLDTRAAELDVAKANVGVNTAALKTAQFNQSKCVVSAPFAAVVVARLAQAGELAAPGTPLVSLLDRASIEVKAEVREADVRSLNAARAVRFAGPEADYPLRLIRVSPAVDKATRLAEARLRFTAKPAASGASGKIEWNTNEAHVPADLVMRRNNRLGVFVAEGKTARFHPLPTAEEGRPALASGLKLESQIVVGGAGEIR